MTATLQRPCSTFHSSVCVPRPARDATQKLAAAGRPGVAPPLRRTESYENGSKLTSVTCSCATLVMKRSRSLSRAMPTKTGRPPAAWR